MTRSANIRLTAFLVLVAAPPLGPAALAADVTYRATLKGSSEVPATQSQGSGDVTATFDPDTRRLSWTGTYAGLSGPVTAAHFHGPAKAGENAGVLVPVTATSSPFSGEASLNDAMAADPEAGRLYVNIHTAAHPKGEIRGQVERGR